MWFKFFLLIPLLFSCSLLNDYSWAGIEELTTEDEALSFMLDNISYKADYYDYMQFPEETYNLSSGDCEDMASLLAHLFIYNVHMENVLLVICYDINLNQYHMVVKVDHRYFEATYAREIFNYHDKFITIKYLSYGKYIDIARLYHL